MNALDLLIEQHDEVEDLISQIEMCEDSGEKESLFQELADKVAAHATMEERLFYPNVMSEETMDLLLEATEEHLAVKRVLADMMDLVVDDERFDAKLTVLKEEFRHHARDEEEGVLFPILRRELGGNTLAGLGNEMLAFYETVLERHPRFQVPNETAEAAQLSMNV